MKGEGRVGTAVATTWSVGGGVGGEAFFRDASNIDNERVALNLPVWESPRQLDASFWI